MPAIPDRLKLHSSEGGAPEKKFYTTPFLIGLFFGPIGLFFASGEKKGSFGSALIGWASGFGVLLVTIGLVFGGIKGHEAYKAHQAEKSACHAQYVKSVQFIEKARKEINRIVAGDAYEDFDKVSIAKTLGPLFAEEESTVPIRLMSLDSSLKKIRASCEKAEAEASRLDRKLESLVEAGKKCEHDAQQRKRDELAASLIGNLNFDLSSRVLIHSHLKKYVKSILASTRFLKLRDLKGNGDYLGFLSFANGDEESYGEYPPEDEIRRVVTRLAADQEFSVTVNFSELDSDCEGVRFVTISYIEGIPLVEMATSKAETISTGFKLSTPKILYLIEDGAFSFISRVLNKQNALGKNPEETMASLMEIEESIDEVAEGKRQARRERAEKIAAQREAERRRREAELAAEAERERKRERQEAARRAKEEYEQAVENVRRRDREWNDKLDAASAERARRRAAAKAARDADLEARGMKSLYKSPNAR